MNHRHRLRGTSLDIATLLIWSRPEARSGSWFSPCKVVNRKGYSGSFAPHLSWAECYYIGAVAPFECTHIVDLPHNRGIINGKDRVER
jgi:hypothetical protein